MAKNDQITKLAPPSKADMDNLLQDYTSIIQRVFEQLFIKVHDIIEVATVPADTEGNVGDMYLFNDGTNQYLYVKFTTGWKRFVPA